jgi:hypothetical protein
LLLGLTVKKLTVALFAFQRLVLRKTVVAQAVAEALAVVTAEAVTAEAVSVAVHARAGNFLA